MLEIENNRKDIMKKVASKFILQNFLTYVKTVYADWVEILLCLK